MELKYVIIITLAVVFVLLNWYYNYKQKCKKTILINSLKLYAENQKYCISESDNLINNLIGIDKINNKVFFKNDAKNIKITIDLDYIKNCYNHEVERTVCCTQ